MPLGTPEPPHRRELAALLAGQRQATADIITIGATLTLRNAHGGIDAVAPLGSQWQDLPGREGVRIFHVPDPDGAAGLFLTVSVSAPGSSYTGSVIDESRLLGLMEGDMTLNEKPYTPGQFLWLAPGEPSSWRTAAGALCVVRYDTAPPDLDLTDIIRPLKP